MIRPINSALTIIFGFLSPLAFAGGHGGHDESGEPSWKYSLGAGALIAPEYLGGEDNETRPLPYFSMEYGKNLSFNAVRGLEYKFFNREHVSIGTGFNFSFGREEDDADILEGLGDIDFAVLPKLFITLKQGRTEFVIDYQADVGDQGHEGATLDLELAYTHIVNRNVILKPTVGAVYGDKDYMQSFFGITEQQSTDSAVGLAEYEPDADLYEYNIGFTAIYRISPKWAIVSFAKLAQLKGEAEDSPVLEDDTQARLGIFASYTF